MIERAYDAEFLNRVANHPAVRPWVADVAAGELDMTPHVANQANVCLVGEHGAFFCFKFFEGCYEVHTQVMPEGRGEWTRRFADAGMRYMFTATDCVEILTRVPKGHVAAAALTRAVGFRPQFNTPAECLFRGERVPCSIHSLTIQDWSLSAPGVAETGEAFHSWLNQKITGNPHQPDHDHNRIVGITLGMMGSGQVAKGVVWYNRWAFSARHPPIGLISMTPPTIKFDAGVLVMEGGEIRLEQCH